MISFNPTEEEIEFTKIAKKVAQDIRKQAREGERDVSSLENIMAEIDQIGFSKMEEPEQFGGMALPILSQVQIYAALAYGDLGTVQAIAGLADGASLLRVVEENEIDEHILQSFHKEGSTIAFIDETTISNEQLTLKKNDSVYTLNGTSLPVRLANRATHIILATFDETGEVVLLSLDKEFTPWTRLQESYYLGLQEAHIARISFDRQTILRTQIIARGEKARGLVRSMQTRVYLLQAAKQLGLMQAAVDYVTEHTASRRAFGKSIAKFQGVSFRVSQMVIETNVLKNLIWQAASAIDVGEEEAHSCVLSVIDRAHKAVQYVTDSAVQLLGGHGFVQDYPVEKWMRDAQAQVLLYGNKQMFLQERGEQLISMEKMGVEV